MPDADEDDRESAGMLMTPRGPVPCLLVVRSRDRFPLTVVPAQALPDGRYELLAPAWTADALRIEGEWTLRGQKPGGRQE